MHDRQRVWEKAIGLASKIHTDSRLPVDRGLHEQMRRCSIVVASQLADAYSRANRGERIRLLGLARSSLYELDTQIRIGLRLEAVDAQLGLDAEVEALQCLVSAAIQRLREQKSRDTPPLQNVTAVDQR